MLFLGLMMYVLLGLFNTSFIIYQYRNWAWIKAHYNVTNYLFQFQTGVGSAYRCISNTQTATSPLLINRLLQSSSLCPFLFQFSHKLLIFFITIYSYSFVQLQTRSFHCFSDFCKSLALVGNFRTRPPFYTGMLKSLCIFMC